MQYAKLTEKKEITYKYLEAPSSLGLPLDFDTLISRP